MESNKTDFIYTWIHTSLRKWLVMRYKHHQSEGIINLFSVMLFFYYKCVFVFVCHILQCLLRGFWTKNLIQFYDSGSFQSYSDIMWNSQTESVSQQWDLLDKLIKFQRQGKEETGAYLAINMLHDHFKMLKCDVTKNETQTGSTKGGFISELVHLCI